ncbi:brefeldin A-inhibited guanine nucleotide-exchange protein 3 isoform X1 [Crotalus tigris]|uniref:brefeldin A-inhibited guanine nucleotide-exchange protein 3 isoform X1 n=2 Tax=Crotalus tigris TaxID=88082 RepID=UPI00192FA299|nr:brefeldin A-inhibited guanine nucleotide-exchange protein 3 isoform X1 [Crotalus tigris]
MEEILRKLQKEASGSKYKAIKESCTWASETLESLDATTKIPPYQLREKCLLPLQLALESKNMKLAQQALAGMQKLLSDERFVSMETDSDDKQLLNQMLNAVRVTPSLNEDLQVEVMKVLLCITYTPTFVLNGSSVLKIAEVCIETYISSYHQRSINTAVRATLSQMLSDLILQLRQKQENTMTESQGILQDFKNSDSTTESFCDDVVSVFMVLCEKLQTAISENQQLQLLYLECILSMLNSFSASMHHHKGFTDLIWKQLCPALIVILGNPVHDKTITSAHSHTGHEVDSPSSGVSDHGRGSGCSTTAPALSSPVARTIYYIAAELVRLVGSLESMKPVLQSLYHRMLLYPPPQHRVEAIKIMKEILGSPQRLCDLAGPCSTEPESRKRSISKRKYHLDLLKLILDGMTEACVKGGIEACYASVSCVCALLGTLDELSQGKGLDQEQVHLLLRRLGELKEGAETSRDSMEINDADFRWQRRILSLEHAPWEAGHEKSPDISISVTTDTGQTTLEGDMGQTTPDDHSEIRKNSLQSPAGPVGKEIHYKEPESETVDQPDVVQRSHNVVYPDITNFLSVDCKARSCGSRYSESNFSVEDQDLSRTEFDSCDQYSMAAEKDSGRSDVSDIGSDNCSLADEEQTPRDCPGHKSLRTAALSLKLLRNQEADQQSARLFIQALETLLPHLIALSTVEEVDLALQKFSSTFCSGMMHSPGIEGNASFNFQNLMNADSLYAISHYTLLLNLKMSNAEYYRKKPAQSPVLLKEFMKQVQSSGVLMVFSQAWVEELYHQVLERNLLGEAGYWGNPEEHSLPLITMLTDIDGLGSSAIGGQLMASASKQSPLSQTWKPDDALMAGVAFARHLLIGCWKNLIDTLSTPLTGRMAGSSKGLAFILGAEGIKEQNQKEKDAICMSLDGLRKAARLSCALGVAANCASALAQMAAASCVQEEKEERDAQEPSDAIAQVKQKVEQKLEQMGKAHGVCLHTAHVLCMDAVLAVGLEMGSHNPDCWPHVFRVWEYISTLEHVHFSDGTSQPPVTITQAQQGAVALQGEVQATDSPQELILEQEAALRNNPVIQPVSIQDLIKEGSKGRAFDFRGGSLMTGSSAAKAILTLSNQADRLFEDAVDKLNLMALGGFLYQLKKASQSQLFQSVTDTLDYSLAMPGEIKSTQERRSALHLFRLGGAMLRIVRSRSRPLLHLMRCWHLVAPHLVEAACHKETHVSRKAVSFIHDILTEVLTVWNEPPHFHFNEALFRPFERIMQLELCDEDIQDQVVTSIGELVEVCSTRIQSGWRPLFSALETVRSSSSKSEVKEYLVGEYLMGKCQAPVFDVFEAFLNTDNIQVFANAATSYIICLMKFVKGLGEADCKDIGDCTSGYPSTDLCLPALDYLRKCSQLLAKIYKMPLKPIFLSGKFANLPQRIQEQSASSEDGVECVLSEFDDDTGLINVWIILLEELTTAISNCPRQHQPPTLDLLFELLRDVTKTPGPGFGIYAVVHLLLPTMSLWLHRSHSDHSYWDGASANFKHAIGLSCELVVEHIQSFIHSDVGYENMINTMLKDLFKLLVACVAETTETISRVGCSCIRYVLVTAGPVFTEEMWRLACCALEDAFSTTLEPVKNLLGYFHSGSENLSSDACEVKMAAPSLSPSAEAEYWRIRAMAQQVFMLDTQCSPKTPNNKEGFEHAQSCVLIIELPPDKKSNGHSQKSIPFRTIVVSLLSHQVLLQNLYDILLEEFVKGPSQAEEKVIHQLPETKLTGFLRYISMQNLAVIFDLLLDSYRTAREFDTRTGLKCLLKKVSGIGGAANLYRQSAMSFNIYFHALICAIVTNQENITAEQVKKILYEDDERSTDSSQQCSSEDEDIFEETAQVSPPRGKEKRQWRARLPSFSVQPVSNADWAWLIKRLHKLCMELCNNYIQMHLDLENSADELPVFRGDPFFILPSFQSETSTPSTGGLSGKNTPSEDDRSQIRDSLTENFTPKGSTDILLLPPLSPKMEKKEQGRKKEWWESASNKIYTIATDKTISKLMTEYKKRKQQQHNLANFSKEMKADKKGDPLGTRGPDSPLPQRPQNLIDQGQMRHSFSAGPEILRQEKRPRSGSTASSLSISVRDGEAQIQAWTNMVLTVLNQIQSLPDQIFIALQPAVFPCISQLTCHVTDIRVRQALREWLGRVGRVYDIIV